MTRPIGSCVGEKVPCMCGNATAAMVQSTEYRKLASPTEAVISAGCFDAPVMSASRTGDCGSRREEARQPALVDHLLDHARQAARMAGSHRDRDCHASAQLLGAAALRFDLDAHRHACHDL